MNRRTFFRALVGAALVPVAAIGAASMVQAKRDDVPVFIRSGETVMSRASLERCRRAFELRDLVRAEIMNQRRFGGLLHA